MSLYSSVRSAEVAAAAADQRTNSVTVNRTSIHPIEADQAIV